MLLSGVMDVLRDLMGQEPLYLPLAGQYGTLAFMQVGWTVPRRLAGLRLGCKMLLDIMLHYTRINRVIFDCSVLTNGFPVPLGLHISLVFGSMS